MLTISALNEFIEFMKSGKLEEEFKNSGDFQRKELLELLETLMDAADIADETATLLIFRGLPGNGQKS